jgi:hypothetical protein
MFTIGLPSLAASDLVNDTEIQRFAREVEKIGEVRAGVASEGPAAAYALIWEWGNVRQTKKGPKTVMGVNPDGSRVWLSIQAPEGYIRINTPQFLDALDKALASVSFRTLTASAVRKEIEKANGTAAKKIVLILQHSAPEDSGDLRESFVVLGADDPDLNSNEDDLDLSSSEFGGIYQVGDLSSSDMFS